MLALDLGQRIPDLRLFLIAAGALVLALAWLGLVSIRHRRALARIPVRLHVAGTRGKSTTTRLVAAGLRAGGHTVVAKTTGSAARLIRPDGSEEPWSRRGPATIAEQIRFVRRAAELGADAIVVECMAVRPDLVAASETAILRATAAVIVNARPDHAEDLGEAPDAMPVALAGVAPDGGLLVLSDEAAAPAILARASERACQVVVVPTQGLDGPSADHAIALAACEQLGVAPDTAAAAMRTAIPDPGFLSEYDTDGERPLRFVNAFSCNDVASLAQLWRERACAGDGDTVVVFNARPDRPLRSRDFLTWLAGLERRPRLVVGGDRLAFRIARRLGWTEPEVAWSGDSAAAALAHAGRLAGPAGTVWGVGNWKGIGESVVARLASGRPPC